jgi:hypothetical protein
VDVHKSPLVAIAEGLGGATFIVENDFIGVENVFNSAEIVFCICEIDFMVHNPHHRCQFKNCSGIVTSATW